MKYIVSCDYTLPDGTSRTYIDKVISVALANISIARHQVAVKAGYGIDIPYDVYTISKVALWVDYEKQERP